MNDVRPERAWFEKAGQDLEMACRALGPENPYLRRMYPKLLSIRDSDNCGNPLTNVEVQRRAVVLTINRQTTVSRKTVFGYLLSRVGTDQ